MTHAVKVKKPEEVDSDFRRAREERDRHSGKRDQLVQAGQVATNRGDGSEQYRIGRELREVDAALDHAQSNFVALQWDARDKATAALIKDPAYKAVVAAAAEELAARLGPWIALNGVITEAGSSGFAITPLPPSNSAEIDEARWWLKEQAHRGVLAVKDLPAGLASLIGGGTHA